MIDSTLRFVNNLHFRRSRGTFAGRRLRWEVSWVRQDGCPNGGAKMGKEVLGPVVGGGGTGAISVSFHTEQNTCLHCTDMTYSNKVLRPVPVANNFIWILNVAGHTLTWQRMIGSTVNDI